MVPQAGSRIGPAAFPPVGMIPLTIVRQQAGQSVPTGTGDTTATFDAISRDDVGAMTTPLPASVLAPPVWASAFRATLYSTWAASNLGTQRMTRVRLNGAAIADERNQAQDSSELTLISEWIRCKPGDQITVAVAQNSGGNLNWGGINNGSVMQIEWGA